MKERISFIIQNQDISKAKFAEKLGISQAYASQLCSGVRAPRDRPIADICREFGCNEVWLRTGEGEPFKETSQEEKIMRFAARIAKGSDKFKKAYVAMLGDLSDEGWQGLYEQYVKLSEILKEE